jgi:tRNA A-37 threonylcarbamoyl transferase component Bud32
MSGSADVQTITMPPVDDSMAPGQQVGAYRIERKLGEGGMGVVVLGTHALLQRQAALKIMRPEIAADRGYVERFLREARAAAAVSHHNLVAILDAGESAGRTWLAFEFVSGGDLDLALATGGPLDACRALELLAQCADGLQALHEAGLVHRDIKPHNIFLDARGRPKLGDFGLARLADGADRLTMTGTGMGTPAYMSPEQANGDPGIDIRADIHALGGTLYTLLTRRTPFTGATPWAVVNAVVNEPAPDPRQVRPDLPGEVCAIVARAMTKRRDDRFQTPAALAQACRAALVRLQGGPSPGAPLLAPAQQGGFLGPFAGSGSLWLAAAAGALLLLPLGLNPLCGVNPDWHGPGYVQPGLWGRWLAFCAVAAGLLWNPLRLARGEAIGRTGLMLGSMLTGALGCVLLWASWTALLDAAEAGAGWKPVAAISTTLAGIGWLAWWARAAWARDAGVIAIQLTRLAQIAIPLLIACLTGHLIAAGGGPETQSWTSRISARAVDAEAAMALALAVPLALCVIAPLLRARTVRR